MGLLGSVAARGGAAAARHILQLEDRRTTQLNRLTRAVDAGLEGPYHAGVELLKLAARPDTGDQSAARHLARAEELFVVAFGNLRDVSPLQSAWAAIHLAVICSATGRRSEGLYWARLAHDRATLAAKQVAQQLSDRADGRVGRLRMTSENTEAAVALGGAAATGVGAAAAGITIATGGLGIVAIGAGLGASLAVAKGMQMYRSRQLKVKDLKEKEMVDFLAEIVSLRQSLGDRELPSSGGVG